jgi:4-hydroxy-3-methylbut-2-enyl diphosphate reductase
MSISGFDYIQQEYRKKISESTFFQVNDTICRQVSNREHKLRKFAKAHDVVLFVSGSKSSNGKALFEICRKANPNTFMVVSPDSIDFNMFSCAKTVGICGATSTPLWLMTEIAGCISNCRFCGFESP